MVPLYGRGQSLTNPEHLAKTRSQSTGIPPRPPACGTRGLLNAASQPSHQLLPYRNPYQPPYVRSYRPEEVVSSSSSFSHTSDASDAVADVFQPVVGMFREMVYSRKWKFEVKKARNAS
ncbi:E3 ubiquitin-protein ligase RMA3 [Bienertia sinuspersici]